MSRAWSGNSSAPLGRLLRFMHARRAVGQAPGRNMVAGRVRALVLARDRPAQRQGRSRNRQVEGFAAQACSALPVLAQSSV